MLPVLIVISRNNQNIRGNPMYHSNQKIIRNKVGLLNLAQELGRFESL